jgi:serine/threonine protein kinase
VSSDANPHALAPGTRILDYTIGSVIGTGGFSIVYKAMDEALGRTVAIKEYFPAAFAQRGRDGTVQPVSREKDTFSTGIVSFTNEGKLLAQFDHPALVRVYRCWEERGTAYLAMRLYDGLTLKDAVKSGSWQLDEAAMQALLVPLCETLDLLHAAHCYHRDVAPDNILLSDGQAPVLLDFGAARKAIEGTQVFTAILKPGYAPIEQYGDGDLKQGPWTDIYALAGVMHYALCGEPPPTAISRILKDSMPRPRERFYGRLPERWLDAMEAALAVKPENRPQSIAEFVELFGWNEAAAPLPLDAPAPVTVAPLPATPPATAPSLATDFVRMPPPTLPRSPDNVAPEAAAQSVAQMQLMREMAAAEAIDDDRTVVMPRRPTTASGAPSSPTPAYEPAGSGGRRGVWLAIAAVSVALIAGAAWKMTRPAVAVPPVIAPAAVPADDASASTKTSLPATPPIAPVSEPKPEAKDETKTETRAEPVVTPPVSRPTTEPPPAKAADKAGDKAADLAKATAARPDGKTTDLRTDSSKDPAVDPRKDSRNPRTRRPTETTEDDEFASDRAVMRRPVRCSTLLETFQLGNPLSEDEQRFLKENCR